MGSSQSRSRRTQSRSVPSRSTGAQPRPFGKKISRKFSRIADNYYSLDQVTNALRQAGLESSNLIVGIDFTKSNEWTGKISFNNRSLHAIGPNRNPYEQAISIIGRTLASFDEDNLIPCFGFGDASTHDQRVFSFYEDHHPCHGFDDALARYRQIVPNLKLSGPTSFGPIIEAATRTVEESGGQYHVLVIIADGQVTASADGRMSSQEKSTIDAIVAASEHPLSIVLVGVGDGPWEMMRQFDDNIPSRSFDNFQFVNFTEIMAKSLEVSKKEALFALAALMEIPQQYKASIELDLLGRQTGRMPRINVLPPPPTVLMADRLVRESGHLGRFTQSTALASSQGFQYPPADEYSVEGSSTASRSLAPQHPTPATYPPTAFPPSTPHRHPKQSQVATTSTDVSTDQLCPVCLTETKDMAFNCGHQTCRTCGKELQACPLCRGKISTRLRLY